MDNTIFAQSMARIRVLEKKVLDRSKLEALAEARDFSDAVRMLQDTKYSEYMTFGDYEAGLKLALEDLYRDMYKISPLSEIIDILAVRYDAHNIKCLIKGKFLERDMDGIIINAGKIPVDRLKIMIKEENFRDMPGTLRGCIERAIEDYKNTADPQRIDITIDRGMYDYMMEIAKESSVEYLEEFISLMIDVTNIKSFIRIKLQDKEKEFLKGIFLKGGHLDFDLFANSLNDSLESFSNKAIYTNHSKWIKEGIGEYIKTEDLGALERHGDNYIIEHIKKAKLISFGPELIIAYVTAKENEIKALRIILTGKKNEVKPDIIRERLRDVYV